MRRLQIFLLILCASLPSHAQRVVFFGQNRPPASATAPTVTTTSASNIGSSTAQAGGTVTSNGGSSVTSEGTCYATTANPTTPCTSDGTATPFTSYFSGLSASTLYYYRAFATNAIGTSYGSDLSFTTSSGSFAPLTYTARTDNCVTGSESGCIGGSTTGEAGSPMSFTLANTNTVPFPDISTGSANQGTTATDADFGATLVNATDESTSTTCYGGSSGYADSFDLGSSGASQFWSQDSKLLLVGDKNGNSCILKVNPSGIHNQSCSGSSCVQATAISTVGNFSGAQGFSSSTVSGETNVYYANVSVSSGQIVQADRYVICLASTDPNGCSGQGSFPSVIATPYVDFRNTNTSVCGSNLTLAGGGGNTATFSGPGSSTWSSVFLTGTDGSVAWGTGGAQDYNSSAWTPLVGQTFILPTVDDTNKSAFYASAVTGPTSGTEPNWTSSCSTTNSTCTDGGVTWTNIGGIGGQGPGFTIFYYRPGAGCRMWNTRSGYTYTTGTL